MNSTPQISVLMPAYNAEQYLREAIDSVLAQTFTDFEFIIINDGSTDRTEEIILSYIDPRIVYVKNEVNLKLIKTLNKGIDLAKGKYIARMDADDICMPERFAVQYKFMEENPDIGVCSSFIYLLKKNKLNPHNVFPAQSINGCRFCSMFIVPFCHPAVFSKTSVLKEYKYSESLSSTHIEDFVLWGDLAIAEVNMSVIPEYLLQYRDNPSGISRSYTGIQRKNHAKRACFVINKIIGTDYDLKFIQNVFSKQARCLNDVKVSLGFLDEVKERYMAMNTHNRTDINEIDLVLRAAKKNVIKAKFKSANFITKLFIALKYYTI